MQESIILAITLLSSFVTIGRFMYEYRKRVSCVSCCSVNSVKTPDEEKKEIGK